MRWNYLVKNKVFVSIFINFQILSQRKGRKCLLNWKRKVTNKKHHISTGYMFHKNANSEFAYSRKNYLFFCSRNEAKLKK